MIMLFILAGALGAIALIVFLLFRQLRELSWQLTQLRVERDSERILHDIGLRPGPTSLNEVDPTEPVLRKRHLALYLGGLSIALARLRESSHSHRPALVASGAAAAVITAAASLIVLQGAPTSPPGTTPPPPRVTTPAPSHSAGVSPQPRDPQPPAGPGAAAPSSPTSRGDGHLATTLRDVVSVRPRSSLGPPGEAAPRPPSSTGRPEPPRLAGGASPPRGGVGPGVSPPPPSPTPPPPSASSSSSPTPLCVDARTLVDLLVCLRV